MRHGLRFLLRPTFNNSRINRWLNLSVNPDLFFQQFISGPVLVFETIVYDFCLKIGWNYLSFRFWIGAWIVIILFILVAIDASALVCYITRFTEENFATLIALIFIFKVNYCLVLNFIHNMYFSSGCGKCVGNRKKLSYQHVRLSERIVRLFLSS